APGASNFDAKPFASWVGTRWNVVPRKTRRVWRRREEFGDENIEIRRENPSALDWYALGCDTSPEPKGLAATTRRVWRRLIEVLSFTAYGLRFGLRVSDATVLAVQVTNRCHTPTRRFIVRRPVAQTLLYYR